MARTKKNKEVSEVVDTSVETITETLKETINEETPVEVKNKRVVDIKIDEKEFIPEKTEEQKKIERKNLLLAYQKQNPVKFLSKGLDKELKNLQ